MTGKGFNAYTIIVLHNKTGLVRFVIQLMQRHISAFQKDSKYCYIAPLTEFITTTKTEQK